MPRDHWQDVIIHALTTMKVECLPGSERGLISTSKIQRLIGDKRILARTADLSTEIMRQVNTPTIPAQKRVRFAEAFPFSEIPSLLRLGWLENKKNHSTEGEGNWNRGVGAMASRVAGKV